jgi:hypothetical protein
MLTIKILEIEEWEQLNSEIKRLYEIVNLYEKLLAKLTLRVDQIQVEKSFVPNSITNTVNCPKPHTGSHPITESTCDDIDCWCNKPKAKSRRWIFEETEEIRYPKRYEYYSNGKYGIQVATFDFEFDKYRIVKLVEKPE